MTASYLDRPWLFKLRKVARYVELYGPRTTLVKIRAQLHAARTEGFATERWRNSACRAPDDPARTVAIIGCGGFAYSAIAHHLRAAERRFLRATFDVDPARSRSLCADYGGAYAAAGVDELIRDEQVRLVYIASNHASHAEYAIRFLDAGRHVHVEKPQVIDEDQLRRLAAAQSRNPGSLVFLGFNRPRSRHFARVREALAAQPGTMTINWFIAGHAIPDGHWYFSEAEGGRILGNVCHWTDLTLDLVGIERAFPCRVIPVSPPTARSDFCFGISFADGSEAGLTFSAKGHTFEGVREMLHAHRGDAIVSLRDFKETRIDQAERRQRFVSLFRDHGHRANILNSWHAARAGDGSRSVALSRNIATARLFLGVKAAIDSGRPQVVVLD
jgi:predicted dehydrogenase